MKLSFRLFSVVGVSPQTDKIILRNSKQTELECSKGGQLCPQMDGQYSQQRRDEAPHVCRRGHQSAAPPSWRGHAGTLSFQGDGGRFRKSPTASHQSVSHQDATSGPAGACKREVDISCSAPRFFCCFFLPPFRHEDVIEDLRWWKIPVSPRRAEVKSFHPHIAPPAGHSISPRPDGGGKEGGKVSLNKDLGWGGGKG